MNVKYVLSFGLLFRFYACKKPIPRVYTGQLLFTQKSPLPLANKKIEIYQQVG